MPYDFFDFEKPVEYMTDDEYAHEEDRQFHRKISGSMKISIDDHALLTALAKLSRQSRNSILNDIISAGIQDVIDSIEKNEDLEFAVSLNKFASKEAELLHRKHYGDNPERIPFNFKIRNLEPLIEYLEKLKTE